MTPPHSPPQTKSILSHLVTKINESFSGDIVFVAPTDRDLTDAEIQQIGHAGVITVASLVLGRGIDIRPSSDIPGGLHVIVATEVAHKRLLKQTICRTGRFGRPGSFSIITLHRILSARSDLDTRDYDQWWMAALHHLTALGVAHLASKRESLPPSDRKQWVQRWLLFLLGCMQRGKEETARVREALSVAPDSDATPAWCIPDDDFAKLLVLVPRGPEIETFYARLETLEGAGPRSVDPKIDE